MNAHNKLLVFPCTCMRSKG